MFSCKSVIPSSFRVASSVPVRHSESRHSWSLHGIVLDIATTRRLTLYPNPILNRKLSLLEMAENGGPFGMAAPRNGGPIDTGVF